MNPKGNPASRPRAKFPSLHVGGPSPPAVGERPRHALPKFNSNPYPLPPPRPPPKSLSLASREETSIDDPSQMTLIPPEDTSVQVQLLVQPSNTPPEICRHSRGSFQTALQHWQSTKVQYERWLSQLILHIGPCSWIFAEFAHQSTFGTVIRQLLSQVGPSTLDLYSRAIDTTITWMRHIGVTWQELTISHLVSILQMAKEASRADAQAIRLQPPRLLSGLRWLAKTALMDDLQKLLNTFLISSFLKGTGNPRDRKEALPIPFAILVKWEEKIMEQKTEDWLTLLLGGYLLATWASLRFADLQRTEVSNFSLASNALRGLCRLTKTTRAGQPFAVSLGGFTTVIPRTGWVLCWLRAVHRAYHRSLPFKPDFVIPVLNHYQRPSFHSPLAYAGALRALRWAIQTPWTSRLLTPMEAQGYTLHSLKVTFLSAAAQLRLPSRARRLQGHHVQGSMQLYSRDDTVDAVWLQQEICKQVRGGWRPTRPLQRGGQPPVPEPPFQVPERLHPEHFDIAPEPELAMFQATDHFLQDIEPISLADSTSSSDSSSSCSDSEEEAPAPREIQRTLESMHFVQNGPSGCCHIAVEAPVDVQAGRTIGHMDQTLTTKCGASLRPSAMIIKFDQVQWPCKRGACRAIFDEICRH